MIIIIGQEADSSAVSLLPDSEMSFRNTFIAFFSFGALFR